MTPGQSSAEVTADVDWLPFRFDLPTRRVLLLQLPPARRREVSFLDQRVLHERPQGMWVGLSDWIRGAPAVTMPPYFIFHLGHCGSTLLSRLLEEWPGVQALREPLLLREIASIQRDAGQSTAWVSQAGFERLLDAALAYLARPQPPARQVVIKLTSGCNDLIEPLLERVAGSRGILLGIPLADYLAAVLKSEGSRQDAFGFAPVRLAWLNRRLGTPAFNLYELEAAQVCALGWLTERLRFKDLCRGACGPRLITVDFGTLLADLQGGLAQIASHFGWSESPVCAASASPALGRYAKAPEYGYDVADREHDLALSRARYAGEIEAGLRWVEALQAAHSALRVDPGGLLQG